jgi:hypothetical protein
MAWEWIAAIASKLLELTGKVGEQERESRGAVLGALTPFHGLVSQVCGGLSLIDSNTRRDFFSQLDAAYRAAAVKLNEESQHVGQQWLKEVDRLMALGRRATIRYDFAYSTTGDRAAVKAIDEARRDCEEFRALYGQIRGVRQKKGERR